MFTTEIRTSRWKVLIAWFIVTVPLTWGVCQSLVKSLPLFQGSATIDSDPRSDPGAR